MSIWAAAVVLALTAFVPSVALFCTGGLAMRLMPASVSRLLALHWLTPCLGLVAAAAHTTCLHLASSRSLAGRAFAGLFASSALLRDFGFAGLWLGVCAHVVSGGVTPLSHACNSLSPAGVTPYHIVPEW